MIRRFYGLHGFLGRPSDFEGVQSCTPGHWVAPDYLSIPELKDSNNFSEFAKNFNKWVLTERGEDRSPLVLVGYSLGGRLALHCFFEAPDLWSQLVLISSHLGLEDETFKKERKAWDEKWLNRFLTEDFSKVVNDWNAIPVFKGGTKEPERFKENYNQEIFKKCLQQFSLAQQNSFWVQVQNTSKDILYVYGSRDAKYKEIGHKLKGSNCQVLEILDCGHRVLIEKPKELSDGIKSFIEKGPQTNLRP